MNSVGLRPRPMPASGSRKAAPRRSGRAQLDAMEDPYKQAKKRRGPAICEGCGAVYESGRWHWGAAPAGEVVKWAVCQACHRIHDHYPAGEVILSGSYVDAHRNEIVALARHQEAAERPEHPLNRIMDIGSGPAGHLRILTTDIHLPRRIGDAVRRAHRGKLRTVFDDKGYFIRVIWHRDA